MRQEKSSDISLLLVVLVLFSGSIGLLHGFKFTMLSAASQDTQKVTLSEQDIMDILFTQIRSDNMDKAAQALLQFSGESRSKALATLLSNSQLTDIQKIKLLVAGLTKVEDKALKTQLVRLLAEQFPKTPLFAVTVEAYPAVVEAVRKLADAKQFDTWKYASVFHTLQHNDVPLLAQLYTNGLRLTGREASLLLDRVVTSRRDVGFVPLLVRKFGADVAFSTDGKRTVLIKAVQKRSPDLVGALVDEGANPHFKLDDQYGSAMRFAEKNELHDIEMVLEKF